MDRVSAEPTHDVLKDVTLEHGSANLVFEPMQAAMSDGAEGIDGDSALGLPAPVPLSPCDTSKATYEVISRRVAHKFLLTDRRSGKLGFFFRLATMTFLLLSSGQSPDLCQMSLSAVR